MAYHGNHPLAPELIHDRDIQRILLRHQQIESKLHEELTSPAVDWDGVRVLKAQKLKLADELTRLRQKKMVN